MAKDPDDVMLAGEHFMLRRSGRVPKPDFTATLLTRLGGLSALTPELRAMSEEMLTAIADDLRAKGGMSALKNDTRALKAYQKLEAATGRALPYVAAPTPAPASPVAAVPGAAPARAALSADDAAAIMAKANALGLGGLGAALVGRSVAYVDALELLAVTGGGAVAHVGAAPAAGRAHVPAAPAAAGGGGVNMQAVESMRAFAAARRMEGTWGSGQ